MASGARDQLSQIEELVLKSPVKSPEKTQYSQQLLAFIKQVQIRSDGKRIFVHAGGSADTAQQVELVSGAAAFAVGGVARYLKHSKTAEATRNLGAIETGLKNHVAQDVPRGRFPPSAPPTPATIPSAQKIRVGGDGWSHPTWKTVKFTINEPQFYQYEIVTAPDRKSATVYARGDLDGDGKTSEFKLQLEVDSKGEAHRTAFAVKDEEE